MIATALVAVTTAQAAPDPGPWLNYGVAGLVVLCLIMGWLVSGKAYAREAARADRLEAELDARNKYIAEKVVPLLTRAVIILDHRSRVAPEAPDDFSES